MDEFIDNLLREDRYLDVILPRISKRALHEDLNELEPRVYMIDTELMEDGEYSDEELRNFKEDLKKASKKSKSSQEIKREEIVVKAPKPKTEEEEIEEANRLRASLGLKPLKR